MESKSYKNIQYAQSESMEITNWKWRHPSIQESFFLKLEPPTDVDDAQLKMDCHRHAVKDFDLQLDMNHLEMEMLMEDGRIIEKYMDKYEDLEQKKLKLLGGKRFHQNAGNAYWYYLERSSK